MNNQNQQQNIIIEEVPDSQLSQMNFLLHQQSSYPQSEKKLSKNVCFLEFFNDNRDVLKDKETEELTVVPRKNKKNLVLITNPKYNANPEHKTFPKYAENCLK